MEGDDGRQPVCGTGTFHHAADERLVPPVHAVERTDGQDRFLSQSGLGQIVYDVHKKPRNTRWRIPYAAATPESPGRRPGSLPGRLLRSRPGILLEVGGCPLPRPLKGICVRSEVGEPQWIVPGRSAGCRPGSISGPAGQEGPRPSATGSRSPAHAGMPLPGVPG